MVNNNRLNKRGICLLDVSNGHVSCRSIGEGYLGACHFCSGLKYAVSVLKGVSNIQQVLAFGFKSAVVNGDFGRFLRIGIEFVNGTGAHFLAVVKQIPVQSVV